MRPRLTLLLTLTVGCTSGLDPAVAPVTDSSVDIKQTDNDTGIVADAAATDSAVMDTASTEPDSTRDDVMADAPPAMPVDCFGGEFGPSSYTLVDFLYQQQVGGCESSACSDFVMFDPACNMSLQVADVKTTVALEAGDCTIFKRWLTSDLLVKRLRDTTTCYFGDKGGSGTFESSGLVLGDGSANKKTWMCPDEPFASHRRCIAAFRAKYFPGK